MEWIQLQMFATYKDTNKVLKWNYVNHFFLILYLSLSSLPANPEDVALANATTSSSVLNLRNQNKLIL